MKAFFSAFFFLLGVGLTFGIIAGGVTWYFYGFDTGSKLGMGVCVGWIVISGLLSFRGWWSRRRGAKAIDKMYGFTKAPAKTKK